MAHQMKNLCVFSVLHCVEGGIWCGIRGYPKNEKMGPCKMNSKMVVAVVGHKIMKSLKIAILYLKVPHTVRFKMIAYIYCRENQSFTLKTVTSLNKEARLLKFHFS